MKTQLEKSGFLDHLPILSILMLALVVRVIGVNFGLPDLFHADEPIIVNHALAYGSGDFNPHFFKIPPLVSYLLFIVYGIYYLVGLAAGQFRNPDDFLNHFLSDPSHFYLLGRMVFGVIFGVATVYVLYLLGRKFFSYRHGLISAFFLAVCFLHVRDSHYVYADIPLLFLMVLAFFPLLRILSHGRRSDYLMFGILFGAAVATKYNAVFLVFPLLVAHFLNPKSVHSELFRASLLSIVTFFILNPFALVDFKFFISELLTQSASEGFSGLHHLAYSLSGGMGILLLGLSAAGILLGFFVRDPKRLVLLSFIFIYGIVLIVMSQPYDRYALPLIPFLCFFAADVLIRMSSKKPGAQTWLMAFAILFMVPSMAKVAQSDRIFLAKDVRTEAREWMEKAIPADSKIAFDIQFFGPRLKPNLKQILEKRQEAQGIQSKRLDYLAAHAQSGERSRYELFFLADDPNGERFLFSKPAVAYNLNELRKIGVHYVVLAQTSSDKHSDFYEAVRTKTKLVTVFNPYDDGRTHEPIDKLPLTGGPFLWKDLFARRANGQEIRIYQLK